jgi:hypothetical protein
MSHRDLGAVRPFHQCGQLADRGLDSSCDLKDLAANVAYGSGEDDATQISDIYAISRLLAVGVKQDICLCCDVLLNFAGDARP